MDSGTLYEAFLEMETELGLFDVEFDGTRPWDHVRHQVRRRLQRRVLKRSTGDSPENTDEDEDSGADTRSRIEDRVRELGGWASNAILKNPFLADHRDVLFFGHSRRKLETDGTWWDVYCDPILERTALDCLYVQPVRRGVDQSPVRTTSPKRTDLLDLARRAYLYLPGRGELPDEERAFARRISTYVREEFGVELDVESLLGDRLAQRRVNLAGYGVLLDRVSPEVAVIVPSTTKGDFIEACKRRGVPVVELQHGFLAEGHPAYAYPGVTREVASFPDYFFTFSEFWTELCRERMDLPIAADRIRTVGYPYAEWKAQRHSPSRKAGGGILFVSQHFDSIGKPLAALATDLRERLGEEYEITFKLHPLEADSWEDKYPSLIGSGVEVVGERGPELYELFERSAVQVAVSSTAIYEGLAWNLRTYVLDIPEADQIGPVIDHWNLPRVRSAETLARRIREDDPPDRTFGDVFRPDAIENFERELDRVRRVSDPSSTGRRNRS